MKRALLVLLAGLVTYAGLGIYATVTLTYVGRFEAAVFVAGGMLAIYSVARAASSVRR